MFKDAKKVETKKRFRSIDGAQADFLDIIMREDYEDCGLNSDGSEVSNFEEIMRDKGKDEDDVLEKQSKLNF